MTDETTKPAASGLQPMIPVPLPQGAGAPSMPPTMHAGQLLIAAGVGEVSVMFGHTRLLPGVQGVHNTATPFVEWFITVTLSAPIARQLQEGLKQALDDYEKLFGPIPKATPASVPEK